MNETTQAVPVIVPTGGTTLNLLFEHLIAAAVFSVIGVVVFMLALVAN